MRIVASVLVLVILAAGGCRRGHSDVKPAGQPAEQAVGQALVLEPASVALAPGSEQWVTVSKGKFKSADPKEKFLAVVADGPNRLKISAKPDAPTGEYQVGIQGEAGPEVALKVQVGEALALDPPAVALPRGTDQWVRVTHGKFKSAQPDVKFISIVPDGPDQLKISVANVPHTGRYHVSVQGEFGPELDFQVQILEPSPNSDLVLDETEVYLTAGKEETRLIGVFQGWADVATIEEKEDPATKKKKPVAGLEASVTFFPIHVIPVTLGSGYKKDDVLTISSDALKAPVHLELKVTSVDDSGGVKSAALLKEKTYYPGSKSFGLPVSGGSGKGATFNLTNNVKIVAHKELKAGDYRIIFKGLNGTNAVLGVTVRPRISAAPEAAPPGNDAAAAFAGTRGQRG